MTGIIVPKSGMTRVGRNDIYWNLKGIKDALDSILDMKKYVQIYLEDEAGHTDEEKRAMEENYRKLEEKIWNRELADLNKEAESCKENLENYYKEKVVEYENRDDEYRWEAEKVRMKYASVWDHMKQAYAGEKEKGKQIIKGVLQAVKDLIDGLLSICEIVYYADSWEAAIIITRLSNKPPEWAEKMLGESEEYFGQIAEVLTHPEDTIRKLLQQKSDTYEKEGPAYAGGYIITDGLLAKITVSGILKVKGKGGGTAKKVAGIINEGEEITDAAKTAGKLEDTLDNLESFYDDVYDPNYGKQFDPLEEGAILDPDEVADIAETASKSGKITGLAQYGDDFGKMGTYVENPNIKVDWSQYAEHGFERMQQRGMTQGMVDQIVANGKALSQNNGSKFAFITQDGVAVVSKDGKLITAWSSEYYDSVMQQIIIKLFGE